MQGTGAQAYPSQKVYQFTEPNIFTFLADQSIKGHPSPNSKCVCPSPLFLILLGIYSCGYASVLCHTYKYILPVAAQGGGGSFKNRKPIGEVGCCESRMAERIH